MLWARILSLVITFTIRCNVVKGLEGRDPLPTLKLPYGTWRAAQYNALTEASELHQDKELSLTAPDVRV
jgi:hypothetical protein